MDLCPQSNLHLRAILSFTLHSHRRKLFVCEDISLNAYFWEIVHNIIYFEAAVLHADPTNLRREKKIEYI